MNKASGVALLIAAIAAAIVIAIAIYLLIQRKKYEYDLRFLGRRSREDNDFNQRMEEFKNKFSKLFLIPSIITIAFGIITIISATLAVIFKYMGY
ncbi:MAG: hypothetical protein RR177_05990 [Oscillospiraceae bacterium]